MKQGHFNSMAPYPAFRRQYGTISDISTPVWRHIRHFDASMAPYPTFRRQYGAISDISTPVWSHIRHFDASMAHLSPQFPLFDAKFEKSRYAGRQIAEILHKSTQRSFGGPCGGKSDAADSFLIVPRASFDIF